MSSLLNNFLEHQLHRKTLTGKLKRVILVPEFTLTFGPKSGSHAITSREDLPLMLGTHSSMSPVK